MPSGTTPAPMISFHQLECLQTQNCMSHESELYGRIHSNQIIFKKALRGALEVQIKYRLMFLFENLACQMELFLNLLHLF